MVNDFSEIPPEERDKVFEVEFHRNTSGKTYWAFKVKGDTIEEINARTDIAHQFIEDKIKEKGWTET